MFHPQDQSKSLIVAGIEIIQDEHGRYNLNVLHKASPAAGNTSKAPNQWLKRKSTKELVNEMGTQAANMPLEVIHGGDRAGTYAHELLAVSYAGWISPAFQLAVNQAFIDLRTGNAKLPSVHNPATQIAIETLLRLDEMEQRQIEQARQLAIAQEQVSQTLAAQQWITIRQYVAIHKLEHQLPQGKEQQAYGRYLTGYCREKNLPIYKQQSDQYQEWSYPVWIIQQTLHSWLGHRHGQTRFKIEDDGVWYHGE